MRLDLRLNRLEQKKIKMGPLMAFIGVPDGSDDVFIKAQTFWDSKQEQCPSEAIRCAFPWPHHSEKETKFLGFGSSADLFFGMCCQVRDFRENQFVFLGDVAGLIMKHWKEVSKVFETRKEDRAALMISDDLVFPEEVYRIISSMVKK